MNTLTLRFKLTLAQDLVMFTDDRTQEAGGFAAGILITLFPVNTDPSLGASSVPYQDRLCQDLGSAARINALYVAYLFQVGLNPPLVDHAADHFHREVVEHNHV